MIPETSNISSVTFSPRSSRRYLRASAAEGRVDGLRPRPGDERALGGPGRGSHLGERRVGVALVGLAGPPRARRCDEAQERDEGNERGAEGSRLSHAKTPGALTLEYG